MSAFGTIPWFLLWQALLRPADAIPPSDYGANYTFITYKYHPDRSSTVASVFGRALLGHLADSPENAQIFEDMSRDPSYRTLMGYISRHQENIGAFVSALWVAFGVSVVIFFATILLRQCGQCGADNSQIVTCFYMKAYTFYAVFLITMAVTLVFALLGMISTRDEMILPLSKAPEIYELVFSNLRTYVRETASEVMEAANSTANVYMDTKKALASGFVPSLRRLVERETLNGPNLSMYAVARSCMRDVRRLAQLIEGDETLRAIGAQCEDIHRRHDAFVVDLVDRVAAETAGDRWRVVKAFMERTSAASRLAESDDGGATTLRSIDDLKARLSRFEESHGLYHYVSRILMSLLTALMFLLSVSIGSLVLSLVVGLLIHRRTVRPSRRNFVSHSVGYVCVGTSYLYMIYVSMAIPMTIHLTAYSTLPECYLCEPYKRKDWDVVDDAFARLWPPGERSQLFAKLVPSEILTKCKNESVSITDLGHNVPRENSRRLHSVANTEAFVRSSHLVTIGRFRDANAGVEYSRNISRSLLRVLAGAPAKDAGSRRVLRGMTSKWRSLSRQSDNRSTSDHLLRVAPVVSSYYLGLLERATEHAERLLLDTDHVIGPCYIAYNILTSIMGVTCGMFTAELVGHWSSVLCAAILGILVVPMSFAVSKYYFRTLSARDMRVCRGR